MNIKRDLQNEQLLLFEIKKEQKYDFYVSESENEIQ